MYPNKFLPSIVDSQVTFWSLSDQADMRGISYRFVNKREATEKVPTGHIHKTRILYICLINYRLFF